MSKTKVIGLNTDADGNARCIKAGYFKMGVANFLHHPNDGLTATCVIEIEIEDEELHLLRIERQGQGIKGRGIGSCNSPKIIEIDEEDNAKSWRQG